MYSLIMCEYLFIEMGTQTIWVEIMLSFQKRKIAGWLHHGMIAGTRFLQQASICDKFIALALRRDLFYRPP